MNSTNEHQLVSKAPRKHLLVSVYHLTVMLANVHAAAKHKLVGFEDANRTLEEMERELTRWEKLPKEIIESALWCCNLLDEQKAFYHPKDLSFDAFLRGLLPKDVKFDRTYNLIEEK